MATEAEHYLGDDRSAIGRTKLCERWKRTLTVLTDEDWRSSLEEKGKRTTLETMHFQALDKN